MVPIGKETAWAPEPVSMLLQIEHLFSGRPVLSLVVILTNNSDLSFKEVCGVVLTLLSELLHLIQNCRLQIVLSQLNRKVSLRRVTVCLYLSTFTLH